jgi:hypothetical protein
MMRQARFGKPHTLFLIVLMLLVLLPRAQAQRAAGQAKVDRLVMGLILPYRDYWRPWINGTPANPAMTSVTPVCTLADLTDR